MGTEQSINLEALGDRYELIGELAGRDDVRTLLGKRKDDGRAVLIVVATTPAGDEGNALSHVAADANLLASNGHPNLLAVLDGRWLGTDAFATVLERPVAPSLGDLLARRDEEFTFPRIANILREANEVLEWARAKNVVHRSVTPETLFVEPGSDRVFVAFAVRPLALGGIPGADADAHSIARLARAMLTRSPAAPERDEQPLAELRPGLPARLVEDTDALLESSADAVPDVSVYIAQIAMADAVKSGEVHLAETRNAMEEQRRQHNELLEKERREHDQLIAKERKEHEEEIAAEREAHEREVAAQARRFQKEREEFQRQLDKERSALVKEREALARERAAHERDCATLEAEREAHQREVTEVRERLEWETAAIATQAELYAHTQEYSTPAKAMPAIPPAPKPVSQPRVVPLRSRPASNRKWVIPSVAAVVLLFAIGVTALALRANRRAQLSLTRAPDVRVVDSVAGGVGYPADSIPDSTRLLQQPPLVDSAFTPPPRRATRPRRQLVAPVPDSIASADSLSRRRTVDTTRVDTVYVLRPSPPAPARDSAAIRDSLARVRFDSILRRDSIRRTDTLQKRDTMPQRFR